jgi:hypothetical protein
LSFEGIPYVGGYHRTKGIELLAINPDMATILVVVVLLWASLNSAELYYMLTWLNITCFLYNISTSTAQ